MSARTMLSISLLSLAALTANCGGDDTGETATTGGDATVNGCSEATAEDHTADAVTTIAFSGTTYTPKCVKIAAGNSVKFTGDFAPHPLAGGTASATSKMQDPSSPIPFTASGTEVTVAFPNAGEFGFFCNIHGTVGMLGAVFVD
jgi:plastocyanin